MEIILWRHGETENPNPDLPEKKRALSARGKKQAETMAHWLLPRLPRKIRIVAAATRAACETADMLNHPYEMDRKLTAVAGTPELLAAAGWPDEGRPTLVICHQPGIGRLASLFLGNTEEGTISVKKCGVLWFSRRERELRMEIVLRAVMYPDLV